MQTRTYRVNTQKAISETIDKETIIINLETGSYYSMNHAGTVIWSSITKGEPVPVEDKNIIDFLQMLKSEGLVFEGDVIEREFSADISAMDNPKIEKFEDMQEMLLADPIHDVESAGWPNLKKE